MVHNIRLKMADLDNVIPMAYTHAALHKAGVGRQIITANVLSAKILEVQRQVCTPKKSRMLKKVLSCLALSSQILREKMQTDNTTGCTRLV